MDVSEQHRIKLEQSYVYIYMKWLAYLVVDALELVKLEKAVPLFWGFLFLPYMFDRTRQVLEM